MTDAREPTAGSVLRPDAVEIHWEARGEGPVVLIAHHSLWSYPAIYEDLVDDLSRDHRVVIYDPRGCGSSSRRGPYEPLTDAADLTAVAEAAGGAAVAIAVMEGFNRAARVAATRPDLINHVIAIGPAAAAFLPRAELEGSEVLAASGSVIEMLLQMLKTDPRSALRTLIAAINPGVEEETLRERLDRVIRYIDLQSAEERVSTWLRDDVSEEARALGDRLWIVHGGSDPLFEGTMRGRVVELYPQAHLRELADGPISRPELTAALVRELAEVLAEGNLGAVTSWAKAIQRGDLAEELWDADLEIMNAEGWAVEATYHGREGLRRWWGDLAEAFSDFAMEVEEVTPLDDEHFLTVQRFVGHFRVTGISFDERWASVITVSDGRITHAVGYLTKGRALRAFEGR